MPTPTATPAKPEAEDRDYQALMASLPARVAAAEGPLFRTDATGLYDLYLAALPEARRLTYVCGACRNFVERYGGLVTLDAKGRTAAVLWDAGAAPAFFRAAVEAMQRAVQRAAVTGVFLPTEPVWGRPLTGTWRHLALTPPEARIFRPGLLQTRVAAEAQRVEEHGMLTRGLEAFPHEIVKKAHTMLSHGKLFRDEKCVGVAEWLLDLHRARDAAKGETAKSNVLWRAAATAPPGFCHVRATMIGTLLEDIQADLPFDEIKRRFDAKMNPLLYQRPQAPPSEGNIRDAEKVIAALGAAGALRRRFARLSDVTALWSSPEAAPASGGVFDHLRAAARQRGHDPMDLPASPITWEKFQRTVLPGAERIELYTEDKKDTYAALVTAADPSAPPLLQWDSEARRNPVSWFMYVNGTTPARWNLPPNAWVEVRAITLYPHQWHGPEGRFAHQGRGIFLLLCGAKDTEYTTGGGYFPENLRSELHGVRKTLEAHAKGAAIEGKDQAEACGLALHAGSTWSARLRVTAGVARVGYVLDRWD